MLALDKDYIIRDGEKVGYFEDRYIKDMDGHRLGTFYDDAIYDANDKKVGYIYKDEIYLADDTKFDTLEANRENLQAMGDSHSNLALAAITVLLGK